MAELIRDRFGIEPQQIEGGRGEFTVWVNGKKVAEKGWFRFPSDESVAEAVREALADT